MLHPGWFAAYKILLGAALVFWMFSGCTPMQVYRQVPPAKDALANVSRFHIDRFQGEQGGFFREILVQEINRQSHFEYLDEYPESSDSESAVIDAEVLIYSIRDVEEIRAESDLTLVKHQLVQQQSSGKRGSKQAFEFAETESEKQWIHRTLDLEIRFTFSSAASGERLLETVERVGFQQSYGGWARLSLIPDADEEMTRLGQLLMRRVVARISPVSYTQVLPLKTGVAPLNWTAEMVDFGHPGILRGNRYAVNRELERAVKAWSYVVFSPWLKSEKELYVFTDDAYVRLKKNGIPDNILKQLLKLHNRTFTAENMEPVLARLLSREEYMRYHAAIAIETRQRNKIHEQQNLAAAHYNLGQVHRMRGELELAGYHYARANAMKPDDEYAQKWTDVQLLMGTYNPVDSIGGETIVSAATSNPPDQAMVRKQREPKIKLENIKPATEESVQPIVKPVELPLLSSEIQPEKLAPASPGLNLE